MSTRSIQTIRLLKFVEEMKKGRYPNVPHMVRTIEKFSPCHDLAGRVL